MTGFAKSSDETAVLSRRIRELETAIRDLSPLGHTRVSILNDDPPENDTTVNIWLLADGRLRARHRNTADNAWVYREWAPTATGSGTSGTAPAPPKPAPVTYRKSYAAVWSQSYRSTGAARTDEGEVRLYYGSSGDPFNGMNRSLVGFDYATIFADLADSTVTGVWLTMQNLHSWYYSGGDIHFGVHNYTAEPGSWSGGGIPRSMVSKQHFGRTETKTVPLPLYFATDIRDGTGKGIAVESPTTSPAFYGYAAGVGYGLTLPTLTVEYAK